MTTIFCCAVAAPCRGWAQQWRASTAGRVLLERLQQTEASLGTLDNRMLTIEQRARELYQRVAALQPPPETEPQKPPPEKGVKEVKFRPPLTYRSDKTKSIAIICEENRLSQINFGAINKVLQARLSVAIAPLVANTQTRVTGNIDVAEGDFNIKYDLSRSGMTVSGSLRLDRKPGRRGETWEEFNSANSSVRSAIEGADPNTTLVQLALYPDSFEVFRNIREKAWDRQFEVGWTPVEAGKLVSVGGGALSGG